VLSEDEVTIWGQVGTASGVTIGAKAVIMGQTEWQNLLKVENLGTPIEESREN
jgi:UDP-3-O-[3-hydroxymyristoyl] glucosamine N-acyltransferase